MTTKSGTRKMLMELFDSSESVLAMDTEQGEKLREDLLTLPREQMELLIELFLEEQAGIAELKEKIADLEGNVDDMLLNVKMAGRGLDKTMLGIREKEAHATEMKESEALLHKLVHE